MPTILIVENHPELVMGLSRNLHRAGYDVISASGAKEAIAAVDRVWPSVIILDVHMPGGGGFAVAEWLKASPTTSAIPVIILSGDSDPQIDRRAAALGVAVVLRKPCETGVLLQHVRDLLGGPVAKQEDTDYGM